MSVRTLGSPRRVVAIFLCLVLAPSVLLVGMGWKSFQQDRDRVVREADDRRRQAADLVVAAVEQAMAATEQSLRDSTAVQRFASGDDAVVLRIDREHVSVVSTGRLAFVPVASPGRRIDSAPFERGDRLRTEGRKDQAAVEYRTLLASPDRAIRAGALIRLGYDAPVADKLRYFSLLESIGDVSVEEAPVSLFARTGRCELLWSLGRTAEVGKEAAELARDLKAGRWSITRAVYEANLNNDRCKADHIGIASPQTAAEILAQAVDSWWQSGDRLSLRGRHAAAGPSGPVLLWVNDGDIRLLLAALPAFVQREWMTRAADLAGRQNARIELRDATVRASVTGEERRSLADAGLPWSVVVMSADAQAELARFEGTRALWLTGFGVLVCILVAGAYVITRSVARELAVARLQTDFVAAVSHEFRTPLTSMRQLTEILDDGRVTDEGRRHDYYRALARQTDRLHRLVESLLDLGRLESGRLPYRLEPLDACALVRRVVEEFDRETAGQGVRVDLNVNGDAWQVAGDAGALTNALWNLLDNAVKYSPDHPTVWVSVTRDSARLLIGVRDEGIGIPAAEQRAIFEKFVRGARAKADGFKGTGIGLSMVHHIVKAHGGDVQVESAPGAGSTFTMSIPLRLS